MESFRDKTASQIGNNCFFINLFLFQCCKYYNDAVTFKSKFFDHETTSGKYLFHQSHPGIAPGPTTNTGISTSSPQGANISLWGLAP
jgi:hypothetical protein